MKYEHLTKPRLLKRANLSWSFFLAANLIFSNLSKDLASNIQSIAFIEINHKKPFLFSLIFFIVTNYIFSQIFNTKLQIVTKV